MVKITKANIMKVEERLQHKVLQFFPTTYSLDMYTCSRRK